MTKNRQLVAHAIRALSMDAVQKANSGHPGAPMGMAEMGAVLWGEHLRVNPHNPNWANRDRFVLSNGHASMLLYSLLHLSGFELSLDDLKAFRQLHSKTPGHPEAGHTPGVETTTGPLGQGIATAVGMALAEAHLAARYNREGHTIVDHFTYCFLGDGCMMEGISHEACSLAGTLKLGKLIALYDANGISIDGKIAPWYSENVAERFAAYGWQVIAGVEGNDCDAVHAALIQAKADTSRPSLIICHTTIGLGSALAGSEKSHGAPLGEENIARAKESLGLPPAPFAVPEGAYQAADLRDRGAVWEAEWQQRFDAWAQAYPELAAEWHRVQSGELPAGFDDRVEQALRDLNANAPKLATRKASEQALNVIASELPELIGGSADLSGSNNTWHQGSVSIFPNDFAGNYVHYGVREFAMAAMMNGLSLHGGLRPYAGTFLVFSDYMKNAIRLSALMRRPVVYVLTHDSIGLGEDGPTHQPIEQVASLRLIPNLDLWRPCDAAETLVAWHAALHSENPTALVLSRQGLAYQPRAQEALPNLYRGGYVLQHDEKPQLVLMATGSEVALIVQVAAQLRAQGLRVQVVSLPCLEVFARQDLSYRETVLPPKVPRLAVEAGATAAWYQWLDGNGAVVGIDEFGASAPAEQLFTHYGLDVASVTQKALALIK